MYTYTLAYNYYENFFKKWDKSGKRVERFWQFRVSNDSEGYTKFSITKMA